MTKTIAIALAITASLVGSESFAGQPLQNGRSVVLKELTVPSGSGHWVHIGQEYLKYKEDYVVVVEDITFEGQDIIPAIFIQYHLEVAVARFWNNKLRFSKSADKLMGPSGGRDTLQLNFTAWDKKIDPWIHHGNRDYDFFVKNRGGDEARIRITLYHMPPFTTLPVFDVDDLDNLDALDDLD